MRLLPSFRAGLAWALLSAVLGMELSLQESLLLKSLGLSAKPSPKSPIPVPSVLWRIFQKRKMLPAPNKDPADACRVEEFNVPGNIIRVFADQGTGRWWFGPVFWKPLCSLGWEARLQFFLFCLWGAGRTGWGAAARTGVQIAAA